MFPENASASADHGGLKRSKQGEHSANLSQSPLAITPSMIPSEPAAAGVFRPSALDRRRDIAERVEVPAAILSVLQAEDGMHWQAIDKALTKRPGVSFGPYLAELRLLVQLGKLRQDGDRFWLSKPR